MCSMVLTHNSFFILSSIASASISPLKQSNTAETFSLPSLHCISVMSETAFFSGISAVFTSSGLLRKNQAHPSIFRLLDEALHFHVQAHGYGFSAPYRLAQALLAYACFYFANPQACNTVIPAGLPLFVPDFIRQADCFFLKFLTVVRYFLSLFLISFIISDFWAFVDST